jgi:hypothetical protein
MTFKDLQKLVQGEVGQAENISRLQARLRGKAFWYWDSVEHKHRDRTTKGDCCFNHIIGLPKKAGIEKPLFKYQRILYKALLQQDILIAIHINVTKRSNRMRKRTPSKKNICGLRRLLA